MIDAHAELTLNPETDYKAKFDAVMNEILAGRHISQTAPEDPSLNRNPPDNDDQDSNSEE